MHGPPKRRLRELPSWRETAPASSLSSTGDPHGLHGRLDDLLVCCTSRVGPSPPPAACLQAPPALASQLQSMVFSVSAAGPCTPQFSCAASSGTQPAAPTETGGLDFSAAALGAEAGRPPQWGGLPPATVHRFVSAAAEAQAAPSSPAYPGFNAAEPQVSCPTRVRHTACSRP